LGRTQRSHPKIECQSRLTIALNHRGAAAHMAVLQATSPNSTRPRRVAGIAPAGPKLQAWHRAHARAAKRSVLRMRWATAESALSPEGNAAVRVEIEGTERPAPISCAGEGLLRGAPRKARLHGQPSPRRSGPAPQDAERQHPAPSGSKTPARSLQVARVPPAISRDCGAADESTEARWTTCKPLTQP